MQYASGFLISTKNSGISRSRYSSSCAPLIRSHIPPIPRLSLLLTVSYARERSLDNPQLYRRHFGTIVYAGVSSNGILTHPSGTFLLHKTQFLTEQAKGSPFRDFLPIFSEMTATHTRSSVSGARPAKIFVPADTGTIHTKLPGKQQTDIH